MELDAGEAKGASRSRALGFSFRIHLELELELVLSVSVGVGCGVRETRARARPVPGRLPPTSIPVPEISYAPDLKSSFFFLPSTTFLWIALETPISSLPIPLGLVSLEPLWTPANIIKNPRLKPKSAVPFHF